MQNQTYWVSMWWDKDASIEPARLTEFDGVSPMDVAENFADIYGDLEEDLDDGHVVRELHVEEVQVAHERTRGADASDMLG